MHHANPDSWECFRGLPTGVQDLARSAHALLKQNPRHPSLHFKRVGAYWSVRVGLHYRALAVEAADGLVWFWIGAHSEYDKLIT
jgi:hypothetical protein